jgi:hypothetical protein
MLMQAQKGEDELAAPALIPRIKRAQAWHPPHRRRVTFPRGMPAAVVLLAEHRGTGMVPTGPLVSAPRPAGCGQGAGFRTLR